MVLGGGAGFGLGLEALARLALRIYRGTSLKKNRPTPRTTVEP
eukprot:CAMPEP_0180203104 /NCGR_PEP_ID=MMETSP0987-20121128/7669_1 /TAXON_ID=697907 /ORGANISM="non described non described, Strain CCMP2293" /LENGTH=42 /DNA_ID= /DNA_START= /DNA_END= /DNA_ORIENTATION=